MPGIVTGGKPDSNAISPEWQKYFKERGIKVGSVREAVEVLFKSNKWYQRNSSGTADRILTNAFGASFQSEHLEWSDSVSEMRLQERVGEINRSSLNLEHEELSIEAYRRRPGPRVDDL